ncbi:MAG TPA: hypothetical protein VHV78_16455 [Gemmatimonadaceae bacterium]|jgi:hypothetical protein|nr:hypothetical protein [Gemmatimonadaceae bacterium]
MRAMLVAAAAAAAAGRSGVRAQGPSPAQLAAESIRVLRKAHNAQSSFELYRRNRLPERRSDGAQACDARVGRYCYWRGDDDDEQPPPEKSEVVERRNSLLALLDSSVRALPGDAWLAGQSVRYLAESGRADDAIRYARTDCRAAAGWCSALAGYAAHVGGRFAAADSEFTKALAAMDTVERARWLDFDDELEDHLHDRLDTLRMEARQALARRIMWMGSPLLSISGTDLWTEHMARFTRTLIAEHAASTEGGTWDDSDRELTMRYGWPTWFSRERPDFASMSEPRMTGHDSGRPYNFFPSEHAVDHVGHIGADDWSLDDSRARYGYGPRYARSVHDLPHQIARFRRGDSTLVVAAWDGRRDTTLLGRTLNVALVLASGPDHMIVSRDSSPRAIGRISTTGVIDSGLVSLEVLAVADRRAARAREGIPARVSTTVTLSDLLLYAPGLESPHGLDAVRDSAMTSDVVTGQKSAGVFWEIYGLAAAKTPVHYTLTLEPVDVGWLRQIAEKLRFADPTRALRVQWDDVPEIANGVGSRGVKIDVSQLRPSRYRLRVSVDAPGELSAISEREIEIR